MPFHSWTPDVYTGAPTPVTAFMAACTKIAAIGALMRVFYVGLGADRWDWQPVMAVVAVATMVVGSVLAITQTDVKRMLAYSSIAHAGFILTAFVGASQAISGSRAEGLTSVSSVMFYLVAYGAATVGAFALVTMVRDTTGEATLLSSWVGLGRRSPLAASVFALFMLSFAGIPLTSGFIGKWAVFAAAWSGGQQWLVVVAVVISVVAAFFYIRVIVLMFFSSRPSRPRRSSGRAGPRWPWWGSGRWPPWRSGSSWARCSTWPSRPASSSGSGARAGLAMTEAHTVEGMAADHALAGVREQLEQIEAALLRAAEADSPMVTEAAQHIIAAGGKRFRPLLVVLGPHIGPYARPDDVVSRSSS